LNFGEVSNLAQIISFNARTLSQQGWSRDLIKVCPFDRFARFLTLSAHAASRAVSRPIDGETTMKLVIIRTLLNPVLVAGALVAASTLTASALDISGAGATFSLSDLRQMGGLL